MRVCVCVCVYYMWVCVYILCVCVYRYTNTNTYLFFKIPIPFYWMFNFEKYCPFKLILAKDRFEFYRCRNIWSLPYFGGLWQNMVLIFLFISCSFKLWLNRTSDASLQKSVCFSAELLCLYWHLITVSSDACFSSELVTLYSIYVEIPVFSASHNHSSDNSYIPLTYMSIIFHFYKCENWS